MSNSKGIQAEPPHIAFLPSGLSPLTPFFRLAIMLASRNCNVSFITIQSTAAGSPHDSCFFSTHPEIKHLEFEILPFDASSFTINDLFIIQIEAINRSLHLLSPFLSSLSRPVSAIFSDFVLAAGLAQISGDLGIPHYLVSTTSARFYSTVAYLPTLMSGTPAVFSGSSEEIEIPGLAPLPKSSIPLPWLDNSPSNHLLDAYLLPNARSLPNVNGILLNTFQWFEPEAIAALNSGKISSNLPPVFPVGPFEPYKLIKRHRFPWLDDQAAESVVYISFGSRDPMSTDQIRELRNGLETSEYAYLWAVKARKVEQDENEEIVEQLHDILTESTKGRGRILKEWVNQEDILAHPAIGGFVNQCEWDSVIEAARQGVPMLAWPQHGDQKMNAEVVEKAGLGIWLKGSGWGGERLVKGEEIGKMVSQIMTDSNMRFKAKKVREEARKACQVDGSSEKVLIRVIERVKQKDQKLAN
ncbi:hypothetical protein RJ639_040499 [Escallonia herrerae]|uniref:Glycosyltransferase n=1 Tax=Escallonia herrerae TaxID=1293975 RepID=A0AA88WG86_9ASTE|nr:hypothetical protein RJ639_040499 [Escallonia herrerae]